MSDISLLFFFAQSRETLIIFINFVCLSTCIGAVSTERISVKFATGTFMKNLSRNPNLVEIGQTSFPFRDEPRFVVAGDIKSPSQQYLQLKWYEAFRIVQEV